MVAVTYFLLAFIISLLLTPLVARLAVRNGVVAYPGGRRIHQGIKPLLGGLSISVASLGLWLVCFPFSVRLISVLCAGVLIVVVGVIDDIAGLKPRLKLAGQLVAAAVFILPHLNRLAVLRGYALRGPFWALITAVAAILFMVLAVNAFNLIDGLDGLATGTAIIITLALCSVAWLGGGGRIMEALIIFLGACLGFFLYNFHPAKVFLGDTGSMLLGYLLSVAFLHTLSGPATPAVLMGGALIFAYPALDLAYAVYRRLRNKTSIFQSDRGHIHHLVLSMGLSKRKTALVLHLGSLLFAGPGVYLMTAPVNGNLVWPAAALALGGVVLLFRWLLRFSRRARALAPGEAQPAGPGRSPGA